MIDIRKIGWSIHANILFVFDRVVRCSSKILG